MSYTPWRTTNLSPAQPPGSFDGEGTPETTPEAVPDANGSRFHPLYRGVWAEHLENRDALPVGGSIFSDTLSITLTLHFDQLPSDAQKVNSTYFREQYERNEPAIKEWPTQAHVDSDVDLHLFFVCTNVQNICNIILAVDPAQGDAPDPRMPQYAEYPPRLSAFKCARYPE